MTDQTPFVRIAKKVEQSTRLDSAVGMLRPAGQALTSPALLREALHGTFIGHALHPLMTDLPIGMWTSATVLDLLGGPRSRPAAQKLVGLGILAAVPTALTGLAEYDEVDEPRDQRTGAAHAVANTVALGLYAASYRARTRSQHSRGVGLALGAAAVTGFSGFLGGHLTTARKVGTRHPSFTQP